MTIQILYFASLREKLGCNVESLSLPAQVTTVQALRELLAARGGVWQEAFVDSARLRAAVDQAMAQEQTPIHAGSEVAFFPPVTGG